MTTLRTMNRRRDRPWRVCRRVGHALWTGFGLAGGGYGTYEVCNRCGEMVSKTQWTEYEE